MSYDGFYSELSTRGTVSELLNQANNIKDSIVASEAAVAADTSEVGWKHAEVTLNAAQVQTNADLVSTKAQEVTLKADRVQTDANLVSTKAQEVTLNAAQVQTNANLVSTKAQEVTLNAAQVQTDANLVSTKAQEVTLKASQVQTNTTLVETKAQEVQDNSDYVAGIAAHYPPDVIGIADPRLTDAREWTATTITQAEAEAGTATTRRAFTAQRVRQAIVAWFTGISGNIGRTILGRSTADQVRSDIGLGTAATAYLTTSSTDGTAGRVLKVGDGGWMGRGGHQATPYGYPSSSADVTNQTKTIRADAVDNGVLAYSAGIHFSTTDTWGRLRVAYNTIDAWIQGGGTVGGTGWTSQVVLSDSLLQATGTSTKFPMSQKAVTDAINNSSIGVGQTWQDVTSSRVLDTTYTNTTGRSIQLDLSFIRGSSWALSFTIDGISGGEGGGQNPIIPHGSTYKVVAIGITGLVWRELR